MELNTESHPRDVTGKVFLPQMELFPVSGRVIITISDRSRKRNGMQGCAGSNDRKLITTDRCLYHHAHYWMLQIQRASSPPFDVERLRCVCVAYKSKSTHEYHTLLAVYQQFDRRHFPRRCYLDALNCLISDVAETAHCSSRNKFRTSEPRSDKGKDRQNVTLLSNFRPKLFAPPLFLAS
ncbi:hypothetical protein AVEN_208810-1 [Araneus ventricosus]|uniref:Uncharacterized protein n=1 Tax=Araneus ventricosus TaxID=182803 RepID=A0A4Y2VL87_ARAVE|nr:hypothetical protein AVEN_108473-1 [Araneus ventricosus]GBN88281.1 hypothetical protein AVEN_204919-1 [Araneus ventricosus]GBO23457.1 hypothetical protein AVEN_228841-1 [Araneus ventricosus]GBO25929.1 hypothetical protein AVEN_208810-1 [Araneus ventricosus]